MVLCVVEFKSIAPLLRYSTCKNTVTLKPRLGLTQGHRKRYHSIRHPWPPTFHRHRPISYRFRDKRGFPSKIANSFPPACI